MAFSIWEYLRERTRDAVLAGMQDALDIAEEGDPSGGQRAAADGLTARLSGGVARQLPEPEDAATGHQIPESGPGASPPPVQGRAFGEGLEPAQAATHAADPFAERLSGPLPKAPPQERRGPSRNGQPAPDPEFATPPPRADAPERRKRGRPRKDEAG